jgi:hypothetical protein
MCRLEKEKSHAAKFEFNISLAELSDLKPISPTLKQVSLELNPEA